MEKALVDYLISSSLNALLGSRVYWVELPQGSDRPYLLLSVVSSVPGVTYAGANGLTLSRVQFDCWGLSYASAKDLAIALETLLSGNKFIHEGINFLGFFMDAERDGHEDAPTPDKLFRTSVDFLIWHKGV